MPRQRNKRPLAVTITASTDNGGRWQGWVTVGVRPDGKPDRRHRTSMMCETCKSAPNVKCACYRRCEDKLRQLEDEVAAGVGVPKGRIPGLGQYLTEWLAKRRPNIAYGTWKSYDTAIRCYLIPTLGHRRLDVLTRDPDMIGEAMQQIARDVSAQAAGKAHRVLRTALAYAVPKLIPINPAKAKHARPPSAVGSEIVPLSVDEAVKVFSVIERRRNRARWLLGIVHGHRQGEALGLAWHRPNEPRIPSDVDLQAGTVRVRKKLQRRTWEHGCADPIACARPHCRTTTCQPPWRHGCSTLADCYRQAWRCPKRKPGACRRHTRTCPPLCPSKCMKHASSCPQRTGGGLVEDEPKSEAAKRSVPLDPAVWQAFCDRKAEQDAERKAAGNMWTETGLIFTTLFGRPIDPRDDWEEWRDILAEAGLPPARVHDARHTAATFLLMQGITGRVAMELMGWSSDQTKRYQHVVDRIKREAVSKVGQLLWPAATLPMAPNQRDSATTLLPQQEAGIIPLQK